MRSLALALLLFALPASGAERVIAVVPLGHVDPKVLAAVKSGLEARIAATVRVEPERPLPKDAFYKPRQRWRAEKILDALDADPPKDAFRTLALTDAEISTTKGDIPDWRVGGLGSLSGKSCVVSVWIFNRFSKTRAQLEKRTVDVAVHEVGHTLGLEHCDSPSCVMRDAKGKILESVDTSSGAFCEKCRKKVEAGLLK